MSVWHTSGHEWCFRSLFCILVLVIYLRQRRRYCKCDCPSVCLSVCGQDYSKMCAWIWMKFCASTGVGTWTNWSTFESDPDYSPDAGTGKYEIESRSNRHFTQIRLKVIGCTVERYCLLHVVVKGPKSSRGRSTFLYNIRLRSYGASNLTNFRISAYFPIHHVYVLARPDAAAMRGSRMVLFSNPTKQLCRKYMRSTECPSSYKLKSLLCLTSFMKHEVTHSCAIN